MTLTIIARILLLLYALGVVLWMIGLFSIQAHIKPLATVKGATAFEIGVGYALGTLFTSVFWPVVVYRVVFSKKRA